MKKVLTSLTALAVGFAFVGTVALTSETASAATCSNISITGTGEGSNNTVNCDDVTNITYTCTNNVLVLNYTNQNGTTGTATVDFNTNAGAAVTGNVVNDNQTTTNLSTVCGPATTPAAPVTPETPGKGAVTPAAEKPAALPYTAGNSTLAIVMSSLVAAAAIVAGSRVAVAAYRRFSAK